MKKVFLFLAAAALLTSCKDEKKKDAGTGDAKESTAAADVKLPYTAAYSSSFKMGNPTYCATILQGSWKDWENNTMDNMKSWVADTVVAFGSDNTITRGVDSLQARWKRGRDGYTSLVDSIDAVIPVYSIDKKEDWVLVWAREYAVKKDGTKDTVAVMETWRMNKDGKADMVLQFDRATRKK